MKNKAKELLAIPPEDWLDEAERRERAGDKEGAKTARQFARFLMGQKDAFENPRGVYTTYGAWRAAAKKAGAVRFEGDKDIAQAFDATGFGVAEWDGAEGYIYRKSQNNPRQRIAVSLSKSRKRNPLESGADISDDEDINTKASNMG